MWRTVMLGDVLKTGAGGTPLKSKKEYYEGGSIKWLLSGAVCERDIHDSKTHISEAGLANSSAKIFPKDTVLVAMYGATAGQVGILRTEAATNQAVCGIYPSSDYLPEFLYYYLTNYKETLLLEVSGVAQPNLSQIKIKNIPLPLISLAEQQRIVAKLDAAFAEIDRAIEFATTRLDEGRDITSAYLEKHFERELDGDAVSQMSEGLEKITYGFTNPMPTSESGKYLITAKNVINGSIDYDNARFTTLEAFDNELTDKSKPKVGDVLLTKDGTLGRLAVVDRDDICVNQSVAVLRTNTDLNPYYLKWQLFSPLFQRKMQKEAGGTTIKHIYITRVDKMDISIPQLEEQLYLVEKTERLDAKVRELLEIRVRQLANLQALKSAILAQELEPPQSEAA